MDKVHIEPVIGPDADHGEDVSLADSGDREESQETQHLSKRALKKLKKRQDWLDSKPERRKKEKEKRRLKMASRKENKDYDETRTASRKSLKEVKMSQSSCLVRVVFDMQFGDLMTVRDLGKCLKQVTRCYRLVFSMLQLNYAAILALIDNGRKGRCNKNSSRNSKKMFEFLEDT